jgi:voltage-gated potassium channel
MDRAGILHLVWRSTLMLALLTFCYYLLPAEDLTRPGPLGRLGASLLALAGFALVVRAQLKGLRSGRWPVLAKVEALLTALYLLILIFATTYFIMYRVAPDQIVGIADRTDSLYFAVTVISTVGFGDIHAVGTTGRAIVTGQMLFDLVYVGAALRALSARAGVISPSGGEAGS